MSSANFTQADLQAKKVSDLKAILSDFKLSTAGVKAELVSRILEHQRNNGVSKQKTDLPAAGNALGNIPSEDKLPSMTGQSGVTSKSNANGNSEQPPASQLPLSGSAPAITDDSTTEHIELPALPDKSDIEIEEEKRKARLARWGNEEELAKVERGKKFGTTGGDGIDEKVVSKLDSELSNKRIRTNANGASKPTGNKSGAPNAGTQPRTSPNKPKSKGARRKSGAESGKTSSKPVDPEEEDRRRKRAERFAGSI